MRYTLKFFLICCLFVNSSVFALESFMLGKENKQSIFINNRILAKVNGKAISVIDVMKKMDMLFYKQFPQYTTSIPARYEFYKINWQQVLQELIDKELIMADAEEHKLPVTNGDVRQEMEMVFGPNIIANLEKVGLNFDEAWQMIKDDIVIRRMIYLNVNAKVLKKVTPQDIKKSYEDYAKDNIRLEEWQYQVIAIRDQNEEVGQKAADYVHQLLTVDKKPLTEISLDLHKNPQFETCKINVSEVFRHSEKEISPSYKEVLAKLDNNSFSSTISQTSKKDRSKVYRIFYLKTKTPVGAPPFHEVENSLEAKLLDKLMGEETDAYLKKLRRHYHVQEHLNHLQEAFEPFRIQTDASS